MIKLNLGYKDPELFFNSIDILIHPAVWHEPFPRVLIESFIIALCC